MEHTCCLYNVGLHVTLFKFKFSRYVKYTDCEIASNHNTVDQASITCTRADDHQMPVGNVTSLCLLYSWKACTINIVRWCGVAREDRVCKECGKGEVEDVEHWLLRCEKWKTRRQPLIAMVQERYGVDQDDLAAVILSLACRNYKVLSFISYMWHARFN